MYTIQYFIDKFSVIPEDQWCSFSLISPDGKRCALGHCLSKETTFYNANAWLDGGIPVNPEIAGLAAIGINYIDGQFSIVSVNNGEDLRFQQPTEKQRVLAALQWCKEQEAEAVITKALNDPDEEEEEIYQEDDENYRVQKMREDHPGHSEEAYRTGDMLGVGFPYVPGDPFW